MIFPRPTKLMPNGCVAVITAKNKKNSGKPLLHRRPWVRYKGENWRASRLAFHLNVKSIPRSPRSIKRGLVLHECDNDWCINFDHLYLGTQKQNMIDVSNRHPTIRVKRRIAMLGNQHTKGYNPTKATRRKLSAKLIGNKRLLGHIHSAATRKKMSISHLKRNGRLL